MEEWARRELVRQDAEMDRRTREAEDYVARLAAFRKRHPILARIWYGRAR